MENSNQTMLGLSKQRLQTFYWPFEVLSVRFEDHIWILVVAEENAEAGMPR